MSEEKKEVVIDYVSRAVFAEARGESNTGKIAVAWVIKNRQDISGKKISEIVKPGQFECWRKPIPQNEEDAWHKCIKIAENVFYGDEEDPIDGATHFLSGNSNPTWVKKLQFTVKIGGHRFYK